MRNVVQVFRCARQSLRPCWEKAMSGKAIRILRKALRSVTCVDESVQSR